MGNNCKLQSLVRRFGGFRWHYSLDRALASSILRLQASRSSDACLQFLTSRITLAFLSTASAHLNLGFPIDLLPPGSPPKNFFDILSSDIFFVHVLPIEVSLSLYASTTWVLYRVGISHDYLSKILRRL